MYTRLIPDLQVSMLLLALASNPMDTQNMIDEVMKMEQFDHPNVMSLIGVCMDSEGGGGPCIVMPFMAKGSLLQYLRDNRKSLRVENPESEDVRAHKMLFFFEIYSLYFTSDLRSKRLERSCYNFAGKLQGEWNIYAA